MKVLLFFTGRRTLMQPEPLNLEALAAMIPDCDVRIVDLRFERKPARSFIEEFSPDVVGVTATTVNVYQAQDILRATKEVDPNIFTVVGGPHASSWPEDFNEPCVDAIVIGIGEDAFKELMDAVSSNRSIQDISGLAIPSASGVTFTRPRELNRDLDAYPFPRRDLTARYSDRYRYPVLSPGPSATITTSRGCPNRCSFCAIWRLMSGRYITRSPENVVQELATIKQRYIRFADGNTFGDIKRMHTLCDRLAEANLKKKVVMDISTNIVVKQSALIEKLRRVGLAAVVLGIEAVDDKHLQAMNKNCTANQHDEAINILKRNGITIFGNFLADPSFEQADFDRIQEYILRMNLKYAGIHITTPLPGTLLFEEKRQEILTDNYENFDVQHLVLPTRMQRKEWWVSYQTLVSWCAGRVVSDLPPLKSFFYKRAISLIKWKTRKDYLLREPGRVGTRLHQIVAENRRAQLAN